MSISTATFIGAASIRADTIPPERPFSETSKSLGDRSSTGSPVDRRVTSTNTCPSNWAAAAAGRRQTARTAAASTAGRMPAAYCSMRRPANSPVMRAPGRAMEAEIRAPGGFGRS